MNEQIIIEDCLNPQALQVHTNFNISQYSGYQEIIESIKGVEVSSTFDCHKYSFLVSFGKMFDREEIGNQIIKTTKTFFEQTNK